MEACPTPSPVMNQVSWALKFESSESLTLPRTSESKNLITSCGWMKTYQIHPAIRQEMIKVFTASNGKSIWLRKGSTLLTPQMKYEHLWDPLDIATYSNHVPNKRPWPPFTRPQQAQSSQTRWYLEVSPHRCNTQLWLKEARNCGQNKSPKLSQITSHFERLNPLTLFFLSESHSKAFKALIIQKFTLDARSEEGLSQDSWATYFQLAWNTCGGTFEAHDQWNDHLGVSLLLVWSWHLRFENSLDPTFSDQEWWENVQLILASYSSPVGSQTCHCQSFWW
jgi:hypothetical protein